MRQFRWASMAIITALGTAPPCWAATYPISGFYPLQQSTVREAFQDSRGCIWLASDLGLWRWITDHFEAASERFTGISPTGCFLEHSNQLWIGTDNGLVGIALGSSEYLEGPGQLQGRKVYDLVESGSGRVFCATDSGLYALDMRSGNWEIAKLTHVEARPYYCLAVDAADRLWAGSDGLVACFEGSGCVPTRTQEFESGRVRSILAASDKRLWVGLRDPGGLYVLSDAKLVRLGPNEGLTNEEVNAIAEYPGGDIWVGTQKGVFRGRNGRFIGIHRATGLASEQVNGIHVDREALLWLATHGGGVYLLRSPYILTYDVYDGLPHSSIQAVLPCEKEEFLVGTAAGFCRMNLDGAITRRFAYAESVTALLSHGGRYWVGGPEGLAVFDAESGAALTAPGPEPLRDVTAISTHPDGRMLVCAGGKLWARSDRALDFVPISAGSQPRQLGIEALFRDPQGGLYAASESGLLAWGAERCVADLLVFQQPLIAQVIRAWGQDARWDVLLHGRQARSLEFGPDGEAWIGTTQGLFGVARGVFEEVVGRGAPYIDIADVALDHRGVLWLATQTGLMRYKRPGGAGRSPPKDEPPFATFARGDGIPSNDVRCVEAVAPGVLLVGTAQGLSFVESDRLEPSREPPRVALTSFMAGGERVDLSGPHEPFPSTYRNVSFAFQTVGFREEGKGLKYTWRLQGFDGEWSAASAVPKRDYTNLPAGDYVFEVKAVNLHGVQSPQSASVAFSIEGPFWATPLSMMVGAITLSGIVATIWVVRRKRLQLQRAAQAATVAKSRFLANVSHEIRTPITAILGCTEMMSDGPGQHGLSLRECVDTIRRNSTHLLGMINDLLDLSKKEAGRLEVDLIPCSVHELLADVDAAMRVSARRRGLELRIIYESETPERILTDPTRLRQTLINLVGNAIKFTSRGGVRVRVRVEGEGRTRWLIFDVEDTGIGIPPEKIETIFDAFTQAETSTARKYGGTGLGLAIAKLFSERLHGKLTARSVVGQGSTFTLALDLSKIGLEIGGLQTHWVPADDHSRFTILPPKKPAGSEPPLPTLRGRVLLAEDAPDIRSIMRALLDSAGASVTTVENGPDAVEMAYDGNFDAILMDIHMPGMDGIAALREIRERGVQTPIVVISADSSETRQAECRAAGAQGFLPKPFQRRAFLTEMARHVQSTQTPSEPKTDGPIYADLDLDTPRVAQAVAEFVRILEERVAQLETAAAQADSETIAGLAHQLRGAGGINGYMCVTDQARKIEDALAAGDWQGVRIEVEQMDRIQQRIRAGLSRQQAAAHL